MLQDYRLLTPDQLEAVEKQCLRTVVQALQEYSAEAKILFDSTPADSEAEVIVLAEDILQYALEVAECYPNQRTLRWLHRLQTGSLVVYAMGTSPPGSLS